VKLWTVAVPFQLQPDYSASVSLYSFAALVKVWTVAVPFQLQADYSSSVGLRSFQSPTCQQTRVIIELSHGTS